MRKAADEVACSPAWEKDSAISLTMVLWIINHVYLLLFLFDFIMGNASFCIFQNNFGACRLICHTNILSPFLSIQPLISSSYCFPLMYSHPCWLQDMFQSSKCPPAFSPGRFFSSGTERISPCLLCLLLHAHWRLKVLLTFSMLVLLYWSSTGGFIPGKSSG